MSAAELLLGKLEAVRQAGPGRWQARCPAHEDRNPSLSVAQVDGRALLYCHAGCDNLDIVAALGLRMADLYDDAGQMAYTYDNGRTVQRSYGPDGKKRFKQTHTERPPELYRLEHVKTAVAERRPVMLVEGEEDARAAESLGIVATTAPMGAGNWDKCDYSPLIGAAVIVALDKDEAGLERGRKLVPYLEAIGVAVADVVTAKHGKDVADHVAAGDTLDDLVHVTLTTIPDAVPEAPPAPRVEAGSTGWEPVDVAALVAGITAGTLERAAPSILARGDGAGLLYRGKVNGIHGDSGSGKRWTALHAAHQVIASGGHVAYIDLEDAPADLIGRLLALGADPEAVATRFHYVQPETPFETGAAVFLALLDRVAAVLVVIDSTGESLAVEGANPNADEDVAAWFRAVPKRIAKTGPAVLILDHMPKSSDSDLWPIGSQRKRAAIDGAQYLQEVTIPFAKGKAGAARLVCAKDRHGTYARGQRVATLTLTPDAGRVRIDLEAPEDTGAAFRPTGYMERVSRALESAGGPLTFNGICERVEGKRIHIRAAVDALATEGLLTTSTGPRNSTLHTLESAYREADSGEPVNAQTGPQDTGDRFRFLRGEPGTGHPTGSGNQSGTSGNQSGKEGE